MERCDGCDEIRQREAEDPLVDVSLVGFCSAVYLTFTLRKISR